MKSPGALGAQPRAVPVGRRRPPAGLPLIAAGARDREAGAADRRDPWARVGEARRDTPGREPVVAVVAGGEVDADALGGRLLEHRVHGQDLAPRGERLGQPPAVRDDVREVPVDDLVHGLVEPAGVVGRADVDDPRARGDGVGPLDVERLLDVPALRLGRILGDAAGARCRHLAVVPRPEPRQPELAREAVRVVADGGGEEGAGDRDGLAAAVQAGPAEPVDPVGGVDLGRRVPADQPGQRRARRVRVREGGRGVLAPVARARADGRARGRRRRRRAMLGGRERERSVEARDRADVRRDPRGHRRIGIGSTHGAPVDPVQVLVDVERVLDLIDGAGRGDEEPVAGHVDDGEPGVGEPGADGGDLCPRRRVAGPEPGRRHPARVCRRARVVQAGQRRVEAGRVAPAEPHRERHLVVAGRRAGEVGRLRPGRLRVSDRRAAGRARRSGGPRRREAARGQGKECPERPRAHGSWIGMSRPGSALPFG